MLIATERQLSPQMLAATKYAAPPRDRLAPQNDSREARH